MATFGFGSGSSSSNRDRKDRSKLRKIKQLRRSMLETLEVRNLMTTGPDLIGIQPNEGSVLALGATSTPTVLDVSPRELVLRFGDGAEIDSRTLNGIQIKRAGADGVLSGAYLTTDLGTNAAAVVDFSSSRPGQQGNGTELLFTRSSRTTGSNGKPASYPIITVSGQRITIDVNIATGFKTTAGELVQAMNDDDAARLLVVTSLLRGNQAAVIADTVPTNRVLTLVGADSARASTNFNSGNVGLQAEFLSVNSAQNSSDLRIEFTSRSFDVPSPPNILVSGQTIRVELNSNPRALTTVQEVLDAINDSRDASALVVARIVSGSPLTRIGGFPINYSPLRLVGGDDQLVTPAYIGLGDSRREVIVRFGETLPDDSYLIDILGNGQFALRDVEGFAFNGGVSKSVRFDLDLGPTIQAVVPQPVSSVGNVREQLSNVIHVYFNGDKLNVAEAQKPIYYQLVYTGNSLRGDDDFVFRPRDVVYEANLNRVTLKFDRALDQLVDPTRPGGIVLPPAALRLRIGNDESAVNRSVEVINLTRDPGDWFGAAQDLGDNLFSASSPRAAVINSEIKNPAPYMLDFPGANDEPSNRRNRYQQHILRVDNDGIDVIDYNFASALGNSNQSVQLNAITEVQKGLARQALSLYERHFGVRFVESDNQGITIAVGDMQAIDPITALTEVEPNRTGGLTFAAGPLLSNPSQSAVIIDSQDFNAATENQFGSELFRSMMRGIGVLLGLGTADELPQATVQNNNPITDPNVERVFPGNADIIHGQYLFRPEGQDIDLYRFKLPDVGGKLSIQIAAERQSDSSLLDAALRLYRNEGTSIAPRWVELAANDDYFSKDPRIDLESVTGGEYAIGVSAKGNTSYDPVVPNSGLGGKSEGKYELRIDYRPPAASTLVDDDVDAPTPLDGDGDGRPGGVFNYWFVPTQSIIPTDNSKPITYWVDKTAAANGNGSLAAPFSTIKRAMDEVALRLNADPNGNRGISIRILGNSQNRAYEIGYNRFNQPMADGISMDVPRNVNVVIDAGAIIKVGKARISVGSSTVSLNRNGGSLQLLGTPDSKVIVTSLHDTVGIGVNPDRTPPAAAAGDWGGIDFRNRIDGSDETRIDKERAGLFLNAVVHSEIKFGGGQVLVDGVSQVITPIHIVDSRPTIANNLVTRSADAAMTATPNSFREDDYRDPRSQASGAFIPDYERIGPDIRGNRVVNNTINGLFVKTRTGSAETLDTVTVAARFNDIDIPYVLAENLVVAGTPGGGIRDVASPPSTIVVLTSTPGGSLIAGTYRYKLVYVDSNGNESLASQPTEPVTVDGSSSITLTNLPPVSSNLPYVGRRLYRSDHSGNGPYKFVAQINATATSFNDNVSQLGGTLAELNAKIRPRLDGSLVIDPGSIIKNRGSRIEVRDGGVLAAEGTASRPIIITSINDSRFGAAGTFDTAGNNGRILAQPGDWGGIFVGHGSSGSLDQARLSFGGGTNRIEGVFASFNPIEVHQADFRMANSSIEKSESGAGANAANPTRGGRGTNGSAAVFVRGAQPILVNNRIRDNAGSAINIDVNSLNNQSVDDPGRSTGFLQRTGEYLENQGPLIRNNTLSNNSINGLEVRGQTLTTESVWDDTDMVHVVLDDIRVPDFHTYGGLRLESSDQQSLVVKFRNQSDTDAGLTASGRGQDIADRIGGSVQLVGRPGSPVVLTSLNDCTIGAGFTVDGYPQVDTLNTGACSGPPVIPFADILVIMDESGSMAFAQDFSVGLMADLDNALIRAGVGSTTAGRNLFGLVGYGDANERPRAIPVGPNGALWGTSAEYGVAANNNLRDDGGTEDGYWAIDFAMSRYSFRPGAERFVILVTNEDRDIVDDTKDYASTLALLQANGVKLQGIVSAFFSDAQFDRALALDKDFIAYKEDGQGGFTTSPGGIIQFADGTTQEDYIDMIFALGGIAGDINQIQFGGLTATSFSEVLVTSIVQQTGVQNAVAGDWRGVRMETFSNDRNVAVLMELESPGAAANGINDRPSVSQYVGQLAKSVSSGDENTRLAFDVHGVINKPSDVDVYSFTAYGGTEVWFDIDRTAANMDTVVELVSADGEILALSDNSYFEEVSRGSNPLYSVLPGNSVNPLRRSTPEQYPQSSRGEPRDDYSTNVKDAGMRVTLPGQPSQATLYHVRVRTSNQYPGQPANTPALSNSASVGQGLTKGAYQLQIRMREDQEIGGSSINYTDIRYATNAVELNGVPRHSPLVGENGEIAGNNDTFVNAQELGNLLQTDRRTISVAGNLSSSTDVDWFTFTIDYPSLVTPLREYLSTIFDIDYADGIGRADMSMYLFTPNGSLVRMGENSNILDDRHAAITAANNSDLGRGSTGMLDPFIGPTELPAGRYFLALTNRTQVPTVLANRLSTANGNANVRILPVSSNRLLVEDRVGEGNATTVPPIYSQFLDNVSLTSRIEYTLGDVPLYFSSSSADRTSFYIGNPYTGVMANYLATGASFAMKDTFIRPNGDYRGFSIPALNDPQGISRYILINPGTGEGTSLGAFDFGVRDLDPEGDDPPVPKLSDSGVGMEVEASTVMPLNGSEFGFLVANRRNGSADLTENQGVKYTRNILYRFNPNTGEGVSAPAADEGNFFIAPSDEVPDEILGAGTVITERGYIDTTPPQASQIQGLAFREATRTNGGPTTSLVNDGDRFTLFATINGQQIVTSFEFNSGPELLLNFAPSASPARVLADGDQFQIDGVTYEIQIGNTLVPTPGVRTVFYNTSMNNEQFANALRAAVPSSIQVGFEGNRLNFSGANSGSFTRLVQRNVATDLGRSGGVSSQVPINFLAQDTAETIAARVVQAIQAAGLQGVSASRGVAPQGRGNEVYLQVQGNVTAAFGNSPTGLIRAIGVTPAVDSIYGTIRGVAGIGNALYAISDLGGLYRISADELNSNANFVSPRQGAIGTFVSTGYELNVTTGDELRDQRFQGLVAGPRNVAGGVYSNLLFGTTSTGRVYAFDTNGYLQPVFANGASFVDTGFGGLDGLAFSNLDYNLWHVTGRRGGNLGHGVDVDIEDSRGGRASGGNSWYFGFEGLGSHNNVLQGPGLLDPLNPSSPRANGEPLLYSYNFPGGALGVLESKPISLAGISPFDLPTLYFNYFLSTENAAGNPMRDSFRVYGAGDDGVWVQLATNNDSESAVERVADNDVPPIPNGTEPDQSVTNPSVAWRQARVSLSSLAGNREVRFRFEFSTAGGIGNERLGSRGQELRTIAGSRLRDGQVFTVNGQMYEIEMGSSLVFPSGAGIRNGEQVTLGGAGGLPGTSFTFWDGSLPAPSGHVIRFSSSDSPVDIANAAYAAMNAATLPVISLPAINLSPEGSISRNETIAQATRVNNNPAVTTQVLINGTIGDIDPPDPLPDATDQEKRRDVDMLRLNLEAGATLKIETTSTFKPLLRLFDSFDNEVQGLIDPDGTNSTWSINASGEYYLGISNLQNNYNPNFADGRVATGGQVNGVYSLVVDILPFTDLSVVDNRLQLFGFDSVTLSSSSRIRIEGSKGVSSSISSEVQQITAIGAPAAGSFRLTFEDGERTNSIPWNATAAQVRSALEALNGIAVGDVSVEGGPLPGAPLTVTFRGALAQKNVLALVPDNSQMIGGSFRVSTLSDGGFGINTIPVLQTMNSGEVAQVVARAIEQSTSSGNDRYPTIAIRDDVLDMTGYPVTLAGPFLLTGSRPGDQTSGYGTPATGILPATRAINNAFEGLYIDDFIIGLAERGEYVTGANSDTTFTTVASSGSEILVGSYQLEIRSGAEYGAPTRTGINLNRAFDPNQALNETIQLRFNEASRISDGSTITLNDGTNSITLEFNDESLPVGTPGSGVRPGNLAINYNPIAGDSASAIAQKFRDAVNSSVVQGILKIGAISSDSATTGRNSSEVVLIGSISVSMSADVGYLLNISPNLQLKGSRGIQDGDTIRINDGLNSVTLEFDDLTAVAGSPNFGVRPGNIAIPFDPRLNETGTDVAARVLAVINSPEVQAIVRVTAYAILGLRGQPTDTITISGSVAVETSNNIGVVIPVILEGDRNTPREQGQVVVENSRIANSSAFGISVTAGARDAVSRAPNPGSVRNLLTINDQRLIPGAVIVNNELIANNQGGIDIGGEPVNNATLPPAPVPFVRIVNNTIVGGRVSNLPTPVSSTFAGSFYEVGVISFADTVVSYDPRAGGGPVPLAGLQNSALALGAPNYTGVGEPRPNQGVVSLGRGGVLVVRFDDNILTGSDDSSPDLAVYEVGSAELVRVEVSSDGVTYTSVGTASFNSPLIDLDQYGFNSLSQLYFVRLTDERDEGGITGESVGADIDAVGAISSRAGYRFVQRGTGIRVANNASPTLLNNIVMNNLDGISIASNSSTTVLGGTLYQSNTRNVSGAPLGQFPITVADGVPLFTRIENRNLYPAPGSPSIDSSIDSLLDRTAMLSVKQPVGLAPSPILAPARDVYGALRVDDPAVVAPPGLGETVFKERGAADRSDFIGPVAVSMNPKDNDVTGLDSNPEPSAIEIASANLQYFEIQLLDASDLNGVDQGSDIDPATVISSALSISKNGTRLIEGRDYRFGYDATSNIVRLTALSGLWETGAVYSIRFVNRKEHVIRGIAPVLLQDGSTYTILDANKVPHYFEIETGIRLTIPVSTDGITQNIADGALFRIDDGTRRVLFEFDSNDVSSTGAAVIRFSQQDFPSVVAQKMVDVINAQGLNLTAKAYGNGNVQLLSQVPVQFVPENSGITSFGETGTTPIYGVSMQTVAGVPQGLFDGQTFGVQRGGFSATFEFDGNATVASGNIRVGLDTTSASGQAALIAAAINGSGLGVVATASSNGYVSVGTDPSVRIAAGTSRLQVVGFPGRTVTTPIVIDLASVLSAQQVAQRIYDVVDAANMTGVDPQLIAADIYMNGVTGLTGIGVIDVLGIRDRAGNPMRATELNGETRINIFLGEGFDYGDAPDPSYPTLKDNNGPRHKVVSGFSLGQLVSADPDAKLIDADNDDGVTFQPIVTGFTGSMQFTANGITLARPGYVSAWIDFDGDGIFEASEKIDITGRIVNGPNSVTFSVPGTAISTKPVAARIRLSSSEPKIAAPTGDAPDGEVEDYMITIARNPYTNPNNPLDVNGDNFVSPIDVLQIVNYINAGLPPRPPLRPVAIPPYMDVNSDGFINALDVLAVINFINNNPLGGRGGEGEGASGLGDLWVAAPTPIAPPNNRSTSDSGSIATSASQPPLRGTHTSLDLFLASLDNQEMGPLPADDSIDVISSSSAGSRRDEEEPGLDDALRVVLQELF